MKLNFEICVLIILSLTLTQSVKIANVTLYEHIGYQGNFETLVGITNCTNVAAKFNDKASSADTYGTCVMLCAHKNCEGRCVKIQPGTAGRFNLWAVDMNEAVTSLKACEEENGSFITVQTDRIRNMVSDAKFYSKQNYKGVILELKGITSCVSIPTELIGRISSVTTNNCVMICGFPDCNARCVGMKPESKNRFSLQDLRMDHKVAFAKPCYETLPESYIFFKYQKEDILQENSTTATIVAILRDARIYRQRGITCGDGIDIYGKYWAICDGQIVDRHCQTMHFDTGNYVSSECSYRFLRDNNENCNCKFNILEVGILENDELKEHLSNDGDELLSELLKIVDERKDEKNIETQHEIGVKEIKKICQICSNIPNSTNSNATFGTIEKLTTKSLRVIASIMTNQQIWEKMEAVERQESITTLMNSLETTMFNLAKTKKKDSPLNETTDIRTQGITMTVGSENTQPRIDSQLFFSDKIHNFETYISVSIPNHNNSVSKVTYFGAAMPSDYVDDKINATLVSHSENGSLSEDNMKRVNGKLVTFSIMGQPSLQLTDDNVKIVFSHNVKSIWETKHVFRRKLHPGEKGKAVFGSTQCAFWDTKILKWSTDGCRRSLTNSNALSTTCVCNHLTTFSVLMNFHEYAGRDKALQITTWILSSISMISLLVTLMILFALRIVKCDQTKITVHLCVSLIIGKILILAADKDSFYLSDNVCTIFGVLSHYVWLCAFGWMAIEAFHLYRQVVNVYRSESGHLLKLYSLAAYGVPVIIVTVTFATGLYLEDTSIYAGEMYCWLTGNYRYSFIIPVFIVLVGNFLVLIKVLCIACTQSKKYVVHKTFEQRNQQRKAFRKLIKGTMSLSVLLGLTWTIGFFSMVDSPVNYYLDFCFVVVNASQGIFICIFHCCMNKEVRSQLHRAICNSWPITLLLLDSSSATHQSHGSASFSSETPTLKKLLNALHGENEFTCDETAKLVAR